MHHHCRSQGHLSNDEQQLFATGEITSFEPIKGALVCGYCGKAATAQNLRRTPNGSEIECPHCNRRSAVLMAGIRIS